MPTPILRIPAILLLGSHAVFLTPPALGQAKTQPNAPATEDAVPEGLSTVDWSGIRAAYETGRYAAYPVEDGFEARNPRQGWRTHFDGRGFLTQPIAGDWTWGLELERYGFAGSEQEVTSPALVSAEGGRVAYAWDSFLEEWYVNDTRGIEHGYTLNSRPPRDEQDAESPLTLTLAVRGELRPEVVADGRGVRFTDESGALVLTYTGLLVLDADGRKLEASFEALFDEGDRLLLSVDERGARYPLVIDPTAQQAYLKASNTEANDRFGYSVAVSGDTVVVGAHKEDSDAIGVNGDQSDNSVQDSGAAYVFVRSATSWSQQAYLKASNTDLNDQFGYSVAISGDTVVVGAWVEGSNATGVNGNQSDNSAAASGAAYVFVRNGTSWSQQAYLKASNTNTSDLFGWSVAVSDDTVVVGAISEDSDATGVDGDQSDDSTPAAGAAYVFVRSGTNWGQQAYLKASNTDAFDWLGSAVGISGDTVVVGARQEAGGATGVNGNESDNSALGAGAAYVFVRSGTSWSQEAYLKASNTDDNGVFGNSVAISSGTIVIGAYGERSDATGVNGDQNNDNAPGAGAAYVFVRSGTSWSQEAYLKASNSSWDDQFGVSVAVAGDTIAVGAWREDSSATEVNGDQGDDSSTEAGAAYVFARNGTSWSQQAYLKASNTGSADYFGLSVAVSGDTVVAGAWHESSNATGVNGDQGDDSATWAGAAYVFELGLGATYCASGPNSSGLPATITASGSTSVAANDLVLRAEYVPNQPGVFFYGPLQTSVPFGNGTLCITGQVGRLDVVNANGNVMTFALDNTSPPSAPTQIMPGSTWNFQAWFRDPGAGGAFFDLSDGLSVTFGP